MKLGFSLQLWVMHGNNHDVIHKMIDELALIGYDGIEFAFPFVREMYADKPEELGALLKMHGLEVASTYVGFDFRTKEAAQAAICRAKDYMDFYSSIGRQNFLMDGFCEKPGHAPSWGYEFHFTDDQLKYAADTANEMGRYAQSKGMHLSWHTHWATFFERDDLFGKFWEQTDPELVSLCPDFGQIALVNKDPVEFLRKNIDRVRYYVHLKDIELRHEKRQLWEGKIFPDNDGPYYVDSYGRWIETGRGDVNFITIAQILKDAGFDGWATIDLDTSSYVARESAQACKDYINKALGFIGARDLK